MLIALAISAMLLTATMVAIDASFHAYAVAAQSASSQTATRMVTHRLLSLVRTSTAHGPLSTSPGHIAEWDDAHDALDAALQASYTIDGPAEDVTMDDGILASNYMELFDSKGNYVVIEYIDAINQLWVMVVDLDGNASAQPLLGGVSSALFHTHPRYDSEGVLVLERGSIDITVEPDQDNTMQLEVANLPPIRVVASTMPRKLE